MSTRLSKKDLIRKLNELVNREMYGDSRGRTKHSMILWSAPRNWKGTRYLIGYTPWRTNDPETKKSGYFALKYREFKNGRRKLVKKVRFGKRWKAKKRANKWYGNYYYKEYYAKMKALKKAA